MLKVSVIGLGKMGLLHASFLSVLPGVKLVALCDKNDLVRRFGKKLFKGIHIASDIRELSDLGLDAVYVTTPPASHFPIVKAIYSTGIARNVFVEKPLASNAAESEELCRLAEKQGINMVGYNRRFGVTYGRAKEILDEGALGEIVSFRAYAYSSDFVADGPGAKPAPMGDVLRDLGCHAIDLAIWFFGELEVSAASPVPVSSGLCGDQARFQARTMGGARGELESSRSMENYRLPEVGLTVKGSRGTLSVNEDRVELKLDSGTSRFWPRHDLHDNVFFFLGGADYFREDDAFARAVLEGSPAEPSFQTALRVDRVIDQVQKMAKAND